MSHSRLQTFAFQDFMKDFDSAHNGVTHGNGHRGNHFEELATNSWPLVATYNTIIYIYIYKKRERNGYISTVI